jgi:hypothetical protein
MTTMIPGRRRAGAGADDGSSAGGGAYCGSLAIANSFYRAIFELRLNRN